ncbi:UDP-glucose 4-epimerase GalE [Marininema halotolerans]|uniref:UDP-glucose 4-epimerase n=1 Tax=Marininema halotolerans TaxID=1155944 RepID=A0A1I6SIF9_9BACL|nr:UDP-glucose 4-epimerase GalE [Marininema halotolerans]SFS76736.1 UDP-glucose 4-epimerase [Marininema halotolerans]
MSVLVTGGAGYIGSHTVKRMLEKGISVVVLDSLVTGHREAIPKGVPFYQGDIGDEGMVSTIFTEHTIDAVIHFAARSQVGESIEDPSLYFMENTAKTIRFLSMVTRHGVDKLVFSSTAAVYGMPTQVPIPETAPCQPINPYGVSKRFIEEMLPWLEQAYGLRSMTLRYFNAVGASWEGEIGEDHSPETHLVPRVLKSVLGQSDPIHLFGTDYDTPDGTCIRDYVHVMDVAEAHVKALEKLSRGAESQVLNIGTGKGYSVREVITAVEEVTNRWVPVVNAPARVGDPGRLVAGIEKTKQAIGWEAQYRDLASMIRTAWTWHQKNPSGYQSG